MFGGEYLACSDGSVVQIENYRGCLFSLPSNWIVFRAGCIVVTSVLHI